MVRTTAKSLKIYLIVRGEEGGEGEEGEEGEEGGRGGEGGKRRERREGKERREGRERREEEIGMKYSISPYQFVSLRTKPGRIHTVSLASERSWEDGKMGGWEEFQLMNNVDIYSIPVLTDLPCLKVGVVDSRGSVETVDKSQFTWLVFPPHIHHLLLLPRHPHRLPRCTQRRTPLTQ